MFAKPAASWSQCSHRACVLLAAAAAATSIDATGEFAPGWNGKARTPPYVPRARCCAHIPCSSLYWL
jgi:transcription elongation factor